MFKLIICGTRYFSDYSLLKAKCDYYLINKRVEGIAVISGCAKGADKLGEQYARKNGFEIIYCPAHWDHLGKSAGYLRNQEMAKIADGVIAFWDGKSKGTQHMITIAKDKEIRVIVVRYE
jgi:hypothetical protein